MVVRFGLNIFAVQCSTLNSILNRSCWIFRMFFWSNFLTGPDLQSNEYIGKLLPNVAGDGVFYISISGAIYELTCSSFYCFWKEKEQKFKERRTHGVAMYIPNNIGYCYWINGHTVPKLISTAKSAPIYYIWVGLAVLISKHINPKRLQCF